MIYMQNESGETGTIFTVGTDRVINEINENSIVRKMDTGVTLG